MSGASNSSSSSAKEPDFHSHLPTCVFGTWSVTSLLDSLRNELSTDVRCKVLRIFFYAVTTRGWNEIRAVVRDWIRSGEGRSVVAFVGTDNGITEPLALEVMQADQVEVRMMEEYQGVFHPKVVWLAAENENVVWVGSNNLTSDGLLHNIEFAVIVRSAELPGPLQTWAEAIEAGSSPLTPELLASYRSEKKAFEDKRARTNSTTFTWSKKREPQGKAVTGAAMGDLILEVMPRETGTDGTQIQIPRSAVRAFFGLQEIGAQKSIVLTSKATSEPRQLTLTVFANHTVRLSISDLEYRDRPCVIVFRRLRGARVMFEIVPENIFPTRYKALIDLCQNRTRTGSRRWAIVKDGS